VKSKKLHKSIDINKAIQNYKYLATEAILEISAMKILWNKY
jgi:hypothetical protein